MDGKRFKLSKGQEDIFRLVFDPKIKRVAIKATTQYGKSEVASMALITIAVERKEKILVVAPSAKQAGIIMGKVIEHLFHHPLLTGMIDYSALTVERLRQERSKTRVTFKNGSEIMILTAEAKHISQEAKNLMGFGATIVLIDESSLIPDIMFSKILRMVGGLERGKIIQLGNPFENNHFGRAFESKLYQTLSINWKQALAEGRLTQDFLDEARETMSDLDWEVFYECNFPAGGSEDSLIPRDWINNAIEQEGCEGSYRQSGLDVARFGKDKTIYIFRQGGVVAPIEVTEKMGTMEVVGWTRGFLERDKPELLCTDVVGLGAGVFDRLLEVQESNGIPESLILEPVNVGESPTDEEAKEKFYNLRAQIAWNLREWFKPDELGHSRISIPNDPELIKQLGEIRYKYSSERKIKIEAKDEMKKRLGTSPDKGDALALAFWDVSALEPEMVIMDM